MCHAGKNGSLFHPPNVYIYTLTDYRYRHTETDRERETEEEEEEEGEKKRRKEREGEENRSQETEGEILKFQKQNVAKTRKIPTNSKLSPSNIFIVQSTLDFNREEM